MSVFVLCRLYRYKNLVNYILSLLFRQPTKLHFPHLCASEKAKFNRSMMSSFETGRTYMTCITYIHVKHSVEGIRENAVLKCIGVVCFSSLTHSIHNYPPITFDTAWGMLRKHYPKHQPIEAQNVTFIVLKLLTVKLFRIEGSVCHYSSCFRIS